MIKKIHIIMLGGRPTFSNIEMENMRSWKRCYPDFEIKIWKDEDCIDWINESSFASYHYHTTRVMAYVSDYLRNKILYEEGGLYLDIDVYAMNRIPDSYFEKRFTHLTVAVSFSYLGTLAVKAAIYGFTVFTGISLAPFITTTLGILGGIAFGVLGNNVGNYLAKKNI